MVLRSYERVALDVRPYDTTPEQRTTIKMGMKTIRRTIYLCRKQALEYHRIPNNHLDVELVA